MGELLNHIPVENILGEGVLWDKRTQSTWWLDIEASTLFCLDCNTGTVRQFTTPERLCSFGLTEQPHRFIAAFESGFAWYDCLSGTVEWISQPPELAKGSGIRLNDGRVDRQGRFWCGATVENTNIAMPFSAQLYCLDQQGRVSIHETNIGISNGICWSPDNNYFYFSDSPRHTMYRYDFDKSSGTISSRRFFANTADDVFPDGAITDSEGFLWSAHWGAGKIIRYSPCGKIDQTLSVPTCQPTCIAFGGPDNNLLFVTSARQDLSKETLVQEPQAGNLFIYQLSISGLPEPIYGRT